MTSQPAPVIFAGIDTHADTHHAALVDAVGRRLTDAAFAADRCGLADLVAFVRRLGGPAAVGVEGTGSYGKPVLRVLAAARIPVVEVDRPDRRARRAEGKSDPTDAYAAATAAASGRATAVPKTADGPAEAVRVIKTARDGAVKARTAAINTLKHTILTAPPAISDRLTGLTKTTLIHTCRRLRDNGDHQPLTDAVTTTLRTLATRIHTLTDEINHLTGHLDTLTATANPTLRAIHGVGPDTAATLIAAAGDNPHRLHSRAAFARYTGCAPIPASSGKTHRHRLNPAGHRAANRAIHTIAIVRLRHDQRTRDYMTKRTHDGLTKKDTIRCLKTHITREIYKALTHP